MNLPQLYDGWKFIIIGLMHQRNDIRLSSLESRYHLIMVVKVNFLLIQKCVLTNIFCIFANQKTITTNIRTLYCN